MNKKELRKELELVLVKTIEEVLNKRNSETAKKIRKTTYEGSKTIAKKFYKSLKPTEKSLGKRKKAVKKQMSKTVIKSAGPKAKTKSKK